MSGIRSLMTAQEAVVVGLANEGVKVVFDAESPYADLENRVMHLRPIPENISKVELEDLRGDCDHELGHFLFTDLDTLKKVENPLEKIIFNAIEDGRVERLVSDRWIGCAENLENSGLRAVQSILKKADASESWRQRRAFIALQFLAYGHPRDYALWAAGEDVEPILDDLGSIIDGIDSLPSSDAALAMAKAIAAKWKKWAKNHTKSGGGKKRGKGKRRPGKAGKNAALGKKAGSKITASASPGDESNSSGSGAEEGRERTDESTLVAVLAESLSKGSVSAERKNIVQDYKLSSSDTYLPDTAFDKVIDLKPNSLGDRSAARFEEALKRQVPILRRRIFMEFYSEVRKLQRHQRSGVLDERALHRVGIGSPYLFKRKMPRHDVNAEVCLLVDWSGSMTGYKQFIAAQCAAAMSQVCDLLGIPNEVLAFTTHDRGDESDAEFEMRCRTHDRVTPLAHYVIKPRNRRYQECMRSFYRLGADHALCMGNVDGEGVLWAARRLMSNIAPGKKPVMIVFSDGRPAAGYRDKTSVLQRHLKSTVERVIKAGVALLGVGIDTDYVSRFYENWVVVKDLDALCQEFFLEFRKLLRKVRV